MQINRKQLYIRYRAMRRKLNYTHIRAIKALARIYHVSPIAIAFELSLAKADNKSESDNDNDSDRVSDVLYAVMTENPFNVY